MRKFGYVAAVGLAPALSSVLIVAPAHAAAATPKPGTAVANVAGGTVYFEPVGDKVTVCDTAGDHYGVRLRVKNVTKDPDATEYTLTNSKGAGECVTKGAANGQPWNLAEKHCFRFTSWLVDNGDRVSDKVWTQRRNYNNDGPVPCPGVD